MKTFKVTYTENKTNFQEVLVMAETYTKAIIEFLIRYPEGEYTEIKEMIK